ncbi:MAG: hypothetical protein KDB07_02175 [Planctomycetes bacterium]|nr:hypothetical protein [Planctomycetota bacterium]
MVSWILKLFSRKGLAADESAGKESNTTQDELEQEFIIAQGLGDSHDLGDVDTGVWQGDHATDTIFGLRMLTGEIVAEHERRPSSPAIGVLENPDDFGDMLEIDADPYE